MTYSVDDQSGVQVVRLRGRLGDGPEGGQLFDALRVQCARGRSRFVVDLAGVTHVDPQGIGVLAALLTLARNAGGTLVLAAAPGIVRSMLLIARLLPAFSCYDRVDGAVEAVTQGSTASVGRTAPRR